jgi:hypothetical protein
MEKELVFALIGTGIYLIGAIPYWNDVLKWRTTPHIFTYIIWWILVGFNVFVIWKNHEYYTLIPNWLMLISLTCATLFWLKWMKFVSINWFDYTCLGLWFGLILYWLVSWNVLSTVVLTAIIDVVAFLPTFKKWWLQPWTESIFIYFMSAVGQIFTLLSLSLGFRTMRIWYSGDTYFLRT